MYIRKDSLGGAVAAMAMAAALLGSAGSAGAVTVNGTDSVYNYGGTLVADLGSTSPGEISLPAGSGRILTFSSVSGLVEITPAPSPFGPHGPDGSDAVFAMNIDPAAGLSGIMSANVGYLSGVFLNGSEGAGPAPATLDFSAGGIGETFTSLTPLTDQVFFIGDGRTGTGAGARQWFYVPDDATTLVLGLVDGYGYTGAPNAYFDNSGAFDVNLNLSAVPEPGGWSLMLVGFGCIAGTLRSARRLRAHRTAMAEAA